MPFEPGKVTQRHVIDAARQIEAEGIVLRASTGYEVQVSGRWYPPKEIMRFAHRLATGEDPGRIYGGERTNKHFTQLGFDVRQRVSVWKLGCNWGEGAPSFYNFIREEGIVLLTDKFNFQVNDLVLITEGFRAFAIAQIKEKPESVISKPEYEKVFDQYKIDYDHWVFYAKADWYILSEAESFIYELRAGIRMIQNREIKDTVFNLWENRDSGPEQIQFYTKGFNEAPGQWNYPCLVLMKRSWDDYGYATTFDVWLYRDIERRSEIGTVKILQSDNRNTTLPDSFSRLEQNYCSLGETLQYYRTLKAEFPDNYLQQLSALRDVAFNATIRQEFSQIPGFQTSLLRSTEAQLVLNEARSILSGQKKYRSLNFTFTFLIPGASNAHELKISFNEDEMLPNQMICVVGKNGTGKTKILSQLANKLTDGNEEGKCTPDRPSFSKIVAASFSYFDKFRLPERQDTNYEFIGIRTENGLLNDEAMSEVVWMAFRKLTGNKEKLDVWRQAIESSLEADYLGFSLQEIVSISTRKDFLAKTEDIFSSGQKIVFQFITRFINAIDENSLLLFDEPETHLHPNIAGRLLRTIDFILQQFRSFSIISTHSPVIVQEIPSRFIRVFDRKDNFPMIFEPTIECFGENLSIISNAIFKADQETEIYKIILERLAANYTLEEIEAKFNHQLSLNARLFLQTLNTTRK